jgi:predicted nuclease of restriction endonuclease-like (RecB) superfamily
MAKAIKTGNNAQLYQDISALIIEGQKRVSRSINTTVSVLYWKIGQRVHLEILSSKRGAYGKQIVATLSRQLAKEFGKSFEEKNLRRMIQFATMFPDNENVVSLSRQLSWSHILLLIPIKKKLQREFYAEMCRIEQWSVRELRGKIDGMLYERTAISRKPESLITTELNELRQGDKTTPDLVFRNPYILDFLGLKDIYSEKSLEDAILRELESFILELGTGFSFVSRQKRMIIDGADFKLDLLFYHRKLKRLVAIDLKLTEFKAAYKSQMELYLRWLEKYEMQKDEEMPIGLILCAEGNKEQIELLQLPNSEIKVAEYLTELPSKKVLEDKLRLAIDTSKKMADNIVTPE